MREEYCAAVVFRRHENGRTAVLRGRCAVYVCKMIQIISYMKHKSRRVQGESVTFVQ